MAHYSQIQLTSSYLRIDIQEVTVSHGHYAYKWQMCMHLLNVTAPAAECAFNSPVVLPILFSVSSLTSFHPPVGIDPVKEEGA